MNRKALQTAYYSYLEAKKERWRLLLSRVGISDPSGEIIPTDLSRGFRSRMKFKIFRHGGLKAVGTHPLLGEIPAAECLWALPRWSREQAASILDSVLRKESDFPVDGVEFKLTHGREQMYAVLSVGRREERIFRDFAEALVDENPLLIGMAVPSQALKVGKPDLNHRILGVDLKAHFRTFFQSHLQLTPDIVTFVRSRCLEINTQRLMDLYCGVGLYSIIVGREYGNVVGVESSLSAVRNARANALTAGIKRPRFFQKKVESFVQKYRTCPSDCVILNPPRSGIGGDVIKRVASGGPDRIISVSCNPETQSRDLRAFLDCGYTILETAAFDMFPFSPFLETAAVLEKS